MAAIGMIAMAGMVGGGVDVSRAYMVQNRLQNACDSAVLAGRRAIDDNGFDTSAKAQADSYFDTNFDETNEGTSATVFTPVSAESGNRVDGTASTKLSTVVMPLFGFNEFNLQVDCSASMSVGNSDVMMVLDTTGSMGWNLDGTQTRITALRKAMKSFYDTVTAAQSGTNSRVRYGFVPYSSSVNVGQLIMDRDTRYLVDTWDYQSREMVPDPDGDPDASGWEPPVYTNSNSYSDITYGSWYYHNGVKHRNKNSCRNNQPSDTSWSNYGSATTTTSQVINSSGQRVTTTTTAREQRRTDYDCYKQARRSWYVIKRTETRRYEQTTIATEDPIDPTPALRLMYKKVTFDTRVFKTFNPVSTRTAVDGSEETSTWKGCIQERDTVATDTFAYSSITGLTPTGALDLDIDSLPNVSNDATKWRPLWDQISYRRLDENGWSTNADESEDGTPTGGACPIASQHLTVMSETAFDAYADALNPTGSTYHDIGMIWGARLSSPTGMFSSIVTDTPTNGGAVARHIIFMTDGQMSTSTRAQTAYGVEYHDMRVTGDGSSSEQRERHSARFLAVCEATKAKGIRVWVIAFSAALTDNLESCASADSAFPATSAAQLNSAFQEIAKNVGELRVVQ
jgi:Flp pilus assembly protein TadG